MTTYLSNKLRAISFLAIVLVVILHSELLTYSEGYGYQLQKMISSEMTRISVPIFFYISGFLLFYNFKSLSYSWYISKLKKRCCDIYRYTFFIFVFHEPILTLVKGVLLRIFISRIGILVIYFIAPILVIGICVICARWINSNFSHMFRIICGGRGV